MNSEIARANCMSEIERLGAVKSPSSKPRRTASYAERRSMGPAGMPLVVVSLISRDKRKLERDVAEVTRQQKITFGEMRSSGVRGLLIYCSD